MKKIERLVGIIYALKENKKLTAKEISNIFQVSERTIYRDIDALSQLNVPIISLEGFNGGYEIDDRYFVPSLALQNNEVLYFLICLKIGEIINVPNMKEDYQLLKYKLLNMLDEDNKKKYMKLLERVKFNINQMVISNYRQDITIKVIESFLDYKNISLEYYHPKKDEYLKRKVTPYTLLFFRGGWYLEGFCHMRNSNRTFRLDRIKNIEILDETYSADIIDDYLQDKNNKDTNITVIMELSKNLFETVRNDNMFIGAEYQEDDTKVKVKLYTSSPDSIISLSMRNPEEVQILEPKEYIEQLTERCKKILEKYEQL